MVKAKCTKCGGWAIAGTYEQARKKINHAVALSRGKKCGDNHNRVIEIKPKVQNIVQTIVQIPNKTEKIKKKIFELHKEEKTTPKTSSKKESKSKTVTTKKESITEPEIEITETESISFIK